MSDISRREFIRQGMLLAVGMALVSCEDDQVETDHLPFPMPQRPHSFVQQWRYLSFLHWEVDPVRLALSVSGISTFPEFNIRTYVKQGGKAGVFLSLWMHKAE